MSKITTTLLFLLIFISITDCNDSNKRIEKATILKADREAPLGWVYLRIYQDSTFEFILAGIRSDKDIYKGKVKIHGDSLFFTYIDSIPKAGKTAFFNDKVVEYVDGEYSERLSISSTTISNNKSS